MRLGQEDDDLSNVEDRRGEGPGRGGGGGGGLQLGLGGTVVVLALSLIFKRDFFSMLGSQPARPGAVRPSGPGGVPMGQDRSRLAAEEGLKKIAVEAFNDTQHFWAKQLGQSGHPYQNARMVLFWDETRSGCGGASAQMGPFYCPADEKVYIDLGFYRELATRFGAPGQFAQAYVIAHEVGHHIQNLLGTEARMRERQRRNPGEQNRQSIRLELQADCYAGVWGHAAQQRNELDPGDVDQGLAAAAAVGDDRLQKAATGRVSPESWTHGSAAQRTQWFRRGFDSGRIEDCDTFAPDAPNVSPNDSGARGFQRQTQQPWRRPY